MEGDAQTLELLAAMQKELSDKKQALKDLQSEFAGVTEAYNQQQQFLLEQLRVLTKIKNSQENQKKSESNPGQ